MSRRHKLCIIAILGFLLFGWYVLWSAMRLHGATLLVRGYGYMYAPGGVMIQCMYRGDREGEWQKRMNRQVARDERDLGEYKGLPQVGPDVDGYHVFRNAIAGHVSKMRTKNAFGDWIPTPKEPPPIGYFVIDVRIDRVYDGLSKAEWLKRLRGLGITREPRLYKPSIYDEILKRNRPDGG